MSKIILLTGYIGSGKSFVALENIRKDSQVGQISTLSLFALGVKEFFYKNFGISKYNLQLEVPKVSFEKFVDLLNEHFLFLDNFRDVRDSLDLEIVNNMYNYYSELYTNKDTRKNVYRKCLQYFGTEVGRRIKDTVWIEYTWNKICLLMGTINNIYIDDWRFPNEYYYLDELIKKSFLSYEVKSDIKIEKWYVHADFCTRVKRLGIDKDTYEKMLYHESEKYISELKEICDRFILNDEVKYV